MIAITLPLVSLIALGAAQSSTVSLLLPFIDSQSLVASIAGSDASATTYAISCVSPASFTTAAAATTTVIDDLENDDDDPCGGLTSSFTVTQGPSTMNYDIVFGDTTESLACQLFGQTKAICTDSVTGGAVLTDSQPALQTATLSASEITFNPVVVTAGSASAKTTAKTKSGSTASSGPKATAASTGSATAKSTNAAIQRAPAYGAGVFGALGAAVAGALL